MHNEGIPIPEAALFQQNKSRPFLILPDDLNENKRPPGLEDYQNKRQTIANSDYKLPGMLFQPGEWLVQRCDF
jgi:hypothetical protein